MIEKLLKLAEIFESTAKKKKNKKRVDLDTRPFPSPIFKNFDYTSEKPNATSPGGGLFQNGVPGSGEKSVGDFIKKKRKELKKRRKTAEVTEFRSVEDAAKFLGIDLNKFPSEQEIKRIYRTKVFEIHPDRNPNSEDEMKSLNNAYEIILNDYKQQEDDGEAEYINWYKSMFGDDWERRMKADQEENERLEEESRPIWDAWEKEYEDIKDQLPNMTQTELLNLYKTTNNQYILYEFNLISKLTTDSLINLIKESGTYDGNKFRVNDYGLYEKVLYELVKRSFDGKMSSQQINNLPELVKSEFIEKRDIEFERRSDLYEESLAEKNLVEQYLAGR